MPAPDSMPVSTAVKVSAPKAARTGHLRLPGCRAGWSRGVSAGVGAGRSWARRCPRSASQGENDGENTLLPPRIPYTHCQPRPLLE